VQLALGRILDGARPHQPLGRDGELRRQARLAVDPDSERELAHLGQLHVEAAVAVREVEHAERVVGPRIGVERGVQVGAPRQQVAELDAPLLVGASHAVAHVPSVRRLVLEAPAADARAPPGPVSVTTALRAFSKRAGRPDCRRCRRRACAARRASRRRGDPREDAPRPVDSTTTAAWSIFALVTTGALNQSRCASGNVSGVPSAGTGALPASAANR
jgi:hypothetical protein